jgi:ribosome-associated protein
MKKNGLESLVIGALEDIKGEHIAVLDISRQTDIADAMIVVSGNSNRQVKALAQNVIDAAKENGFQVLGVEGFEEGDWVLVDLVDVIVQVMIPSVRDFYDLEKLWSLTPRKSGEENPK